METLLLDEDDEDTRNLYDEYLKLKYSNEELKLIGTFFIDTVYYSTLFFNTSYLHYTIQDD